ncbi:hypothetical protein ABEX25_28525 [Paenibacillus thiaminolyticus]|uniref:hypothetical protein n=1 Tax=Paenibacillus thiaminolyticus TaxID=49283 RepID=UPI003D27BA33
MLVLLLLLMGCSGQKYKPDTFSQDDMCIVKTKGKAKVCYGMSRSEVEKVLGTGKKESTVAGMFTYDFGIRIFYRKNNDGVAGIILDQDSKDVFKTARGIEIGMPKEDFKKIHGESHALENKDYITYVFDPKTNEFLDEKYYEQKRDLEEMERIYLLSNRFDINGSIDMISLFDLKMGIYFF